MPLFHPRPRRHGVDGPGRSMRNTLSSNKACILILMIWASIDVGRSVPAAELTNVNVKSMLRGCCFAGSRTDMQAMGGYGTSANAPKKVIDHGVGRDGQVVLLALSQERVPFNRNYRGLRLVLVNRSKREAEFPATDSQLNIVQEAKDAKGKWRPIEYLATSWCGNSEHRVFLPSGHYWEFAAPAYTGSMKTKLRFVLRGEKSLYSNEFDGSINPGQFNKRRSTPTGGIMDPYHE